MPIPKIIHQTFPSRRDMPDFLIENTRKLRAMNPGWEYRLYEDADCESFIQDHYGAATLKLFQAIHPNYGAARADFFRYLLLYRYGGVYLDIKSGCREPFDSFLKDTDEFLLSYWRDARDGYHPAFGVTAEFQQWHIMAAAGHPFLAAVIAQVSENLRQYDPLRHGVGKMAVLQVTGPIAYTRTIAPLLPSHPHRFIEAEAEGIIYSVTPMRHDRIFRKHYSKQKRPLLRFMAVRKNYLSPRIILVILMYINGRFYKFLSKTLMALRPRR
jgi:hypothetical protein